MCWTLKRGEHYQKAVVLEGLLPFVARHRQLAWHAGSVGEDELPEAALLCLHVLEEGGRGTVVLSLPKRAHLLGLKSALFGRRQLGPQRVWYAMEEDGAREGVPASHHRAHSLIIF